MATCFPLLLLPVSQDSSSHHLGSGSFVHGRTPPLVRGRKLLLLSLFSPPHSFSLSSLSPLTPNETRVPKPAMYGPPEEDGYPDAPHPAHPAARPNRGADHAPEVVESHGLEHDPAEHHRSYPEAVAAPAGALPSRPPLPAYSSSSYHGAKGGGGYAHTKEGGLEPPGSSHAVAISSARAPRRPRICGLSRLAFFAALSLLAVALVAVGLGVGLGVGLQHSSNNRGGAAAAASSPSASGASVPSPTSTVTPSGKGNATCVAGLRYCGWDLIEQHRKSTNTPSSSSSFAVKAHGAQLTGS